MMMKRHEQRPPSLELSKNKRNRSVNTSDREACSERIAESNEGLIAVQTRPTASSKKSSFMEEESLSLPSLQSQSQKPTSNNHNKGISLAKNNQRENVSIAEGKEILHSSKRRRRMSWNGVVSHLSELEKFSDQRYPLSIIVSKRSDCSVSSLISMLTTPYEIISSSSSSQSSSDSDTSMSKNDCWNSDHRKNNGSMGIPLSINCQYEQISELTNDRFLLNDGWTSIDF